MPGTGRLIDGVDWQDLLEVTARGHLATGLMPTALWTLTKHFTWGVPASEAQWVKNPQPLRLLWDASSVLVGCSGLKDPVLPQVWLEFCPWPVNV